MRQALLLQDLVAFWELIHWSAHCAFFMTVGKVSMALKSLFLFFLHPALDVAGVNVEALYLTEDILRHYLDAIEASSLWNIDLYNNNKVTMIL